MALFEGYERRMPQLQPVLEKYGFKDFDELKAYNNSKGVDAYKIVEGIQPIAFENAKWAYELGAAIALKNLDLPEIPEILAGPTAFVFCDGDVAAPAKALKDFAKDHEALEIKGGIVDGKVYSVEEALKVADLPSKEQLVAMLLSTMLAPVTGLARVCAAPAEGLARTVQAIADQKAA